MTTSYINALLENDLSPREFALQCARSFNMLVDMMDEEIGSEIPNELPESSALLYAKKRLEQASKRIKHVKKMSLARAQKYADTEYEQSKNFYTQAIQRTAKNAFKLASVMAEVATYKPDTEALKEHKDFMINQLGHGIKSENPEYYIECLNELKPLSAQEWKANEIQKAQTVIDSCLADIEKAQVVRVKRNKELQELKASITHFSS